MKKAVREYQDSSPKFGMTVSLQKTMSMAAGQCVDEKDKEPMDVEGGEIENVEEIFYLGSLITTAGRVDADIEVSVAKASEALRRAVFGDRNLTLRTKRKVYQARFLSVIMSYPEAC